MSDKVFRNVKVIDRGSLEPSSWLVSVDGTPHAIVLNSGITPDDIANGVEEDNPDSRVDLLRLGREPVSYSRPAGERAYA